VLVAYHLEQNARVSCIFTQSPLPYASSWYFLALSFTLFAAVIFLIIFHQRCFEGLSNCYGLFVPYPEVVLTDDDDAHDDYVDELRLRL
jgi:hypothetical protein